jgi:hypothetical protein
LSRASRIGPVLLWPDPMLPRAFRDVAGRPNSRGVSAHLFAVGARALTVVGVLARLPTVRRGTADAHRRRSLRRLRRPRADAVVRGHAPAGGVCDQNRGNG